MWNGGGGKGRECGKGSGVGRRERSEDRGVRGERGVRREG